MKALGAALLLLTLGQEAKREGATCIAAVEGAAAVGAVAVGGHGGVDLLVEGRRSTLGARRNVFSLAFHGSRLIEAGGKSGESGLVQCWEWKTGKLLWSRAVHGDAAMSAAASEKLVFSGGADKRIAVLDAASGERRALLEGHSGAVLALSVSPDGSTLASGGADGTLRLWSIEKLELVRAIHNHTAAVNALAWSPDGKHLASGSSDRTVRVWQPSIGRLVRIIRGHDDRVLSLAFSEKHIVSGSADGKLRRIDAASDAILETLDLHRDWISGVAIAGGKLFSADWTGRVVAWENGGPRDLRP